MHAVMGRHGHGVRSSWVMGHGHACYGWLAMGVGVRGHGASVWVVGVPWLWQGEGGEWGPHTKESIRCIPQSGTLKNQKESLFRSHRAA